MTKRPSLNKGLAGNMKALAEDMKPDRETLTDSAAKQPKVPKTKRGDMKKLLTPVDPAIHKRLKILAIEQDRTLEDVTRAALTEYLAAHGKS